MKRIISVLLFLSVLLSGTSLVSCDEADVKSEPMTKQYYDLFNTVSVIYSYAGDSRESFGRNCSVAETVLRDYHKLFDVYYEYDGITNLATVNRMAGEGPLKVDERLIDFLLYAKEMYALTGGRTNIALGSVLSLWHDAREGADEDGASTPPTEEALREASLHTSIDSIVIDKEAFTVEITDPALSIDVGAIGKGYAVERAKEALIAHGVTSYVINVGGNVAAIGTKDGKDGWKTAIKNPNNPSEYALCVMISDTSCVTSGNYERYFIHGGKRYHHVIDPETLMPSEYFASVTVITEDSALADTLSTALFVMSYEDGLSLISSLSGVEAVWIYGSGEIKYTDGVRIVS